MSTKFTEGFKEQAVQKALAQGAVSQKVIADELNVGYSTLQRWIRDYKKMNQKTDNVKQQRPSDVTPTQRHAGLDKAILMKRAEIYEMAKAKNPSRWSGEPRNWTWQDAVLLNPDQAPEKTTVKELKLAL